MKLNRLLEMTILLLSRGSVTAGELSERFGVSRRTIYRDIDDLSGAGVPVCMTRGSNGGISLIDGYTVGRAMLSQPESDSMMVALRMLKAAKYPDVNPLLEKLGAVLQNRTAADWITIEPEPWETDPNEKNRFQNIKEAILGRRVIEFDYVNMKGERTRRTAEPIRLIFSWQSWYLRGFCRLRGEVRTFRVSRIKNLMLKSETFSLRATPEPISRWDSNTKMTTLRLRFDEQVLYRVFDDFDDRTIEREPDGSCTVEVTWPEDEWVYGYLLSFGHSVRVLAPEHVRSILIQKLKKSLENYQSEIEI